MYCGVRHDVSVSGSSELHRFCAPRLMYQDVHCNVCLVENHDERYNISRFLLDRSRNNLLWTKAVLAIFDKEKVR